MNSYAAVKLLLGHAHLHGDTKALGDFTSVWTEDMEAHDSVAVSLVHEHFRVREGSLRSVFIELPLKRLKVGVIGRDVICSKLFLCLVFSVADGSIFQRSEHSSGYVQIVHLLSGTLEKSPGQEHTGLDGDWRELELTVDNITDGVDVGHIGLLNVVDLELTVLLGNKTSSRKIESFSDCIPTNGKQDSVVFGLLFFSALLESDKNLAVGTVWPLELSWGRFLEKFDMAVLGHKGANLLSYILIKASKQNGSNHHSRVIAESGEEAGTFQSNVGCADNESVSRSLW